MSTVNEALAGALCCALIQGACRLDPTPLERTVSAPASSDPVRTAPAPAPYPRGAWRLAKPGALEPVALWFSHIVIRHAQARPEVSFNLAFWSSVSATTRTRAEALALAHEIAERAARDISQFPALARAYSEDLPSRDEGGAMGAQSASQLDAWPRVLDALAALQPGEVSRVVETPYGFHIFLGLAAPPEEEEVSGTHIVIGHDAAPWLGVFARGEPPRRTRDEALALANAVYRDALAEPWRFHELVQRHSEHRDASAGGDFGTWSTREPNPFPPRTKRARELASGHVGAPIETHLGFEIIQRTPPRPRNRYRAALIVFPIQPRLDRASAVTDRAARAQALESATLAAERLALEPARFQDYASHVSVMQWQEGRENHELSAALEGLRPGQITRNPVECEHGVVIARRLDPEAVPPRVFTTELPTLDDPGLAAFLATLPTRDTSPFLLELARRQARELSLSSEVAERLVSLHQVPLGVEPSAPEALRRAYGEMFSQTRRLLGGARYSHYRAGLTRDAAAFLLPADPHGHLGL